VGCVGSGNLAYGFSGRRHAAERESRSGDRTEVGRDRPHAAFAVVAGTADGAISEKVSCRWQTTIRHIVRVVATNRIVWKVFGLALAKK
jgi:hypothetical protein